MSELENKKSFEKKRSQWIDIWGRFKKNKGAMVGLGILIIFISIAITEDLWISQDKVTTIVVEEKLIHPCKEHWFGTDEMGRDIFWRTVYATRFSIVIGFVAVAVSAIVGIPIGAIAGYYGGKIESVIMRITDIFSAVPTILMAIAIVSMLGRTTFNLMLAVGLSSVPLFIRVSRASVLTVKNSEYIEAVRALGKTDIYIIFRHVLPNCLSPIIVQITLRVASAIVSASSLSFLGLGIKPPTPEWGALLTAGKEFIMGYSYMCLFPGLAIMITVLAFNLVGDGLRDAMDPKLRH
ncbi:MAG: ABC transporter permease [Sphaerochaetaceae bacterium]|nr:ABC transporter permease [Sphaerochaetaceae bacterium]